MTIMAVLPELAVLSASAVFGAGTALANDRAIAARKRAALRRFLDAVTFVIVMTSTLLAGFIADALLPLGSIPQASLLMLVWILGYFATAYFCGFMLFRRRRSALRGGSRSIPTAGH